MGTLQTFHIGAAVNVCLGFFLLSTVYQVFTRRKPTDIFLLIILVAGAYLFIFQIKPVLGQVVELQDENDIPLELKEGLQMVGFNHMILTLMMALALPTMIMFGEGGADEKCKHKPGQKPH